MTQKRWLIFIIVVLSLITMSIMLLLSESNTTVSSNTIVQSSIKEIPPANTVHTESFIVYKRELNMFNSDESDIGLRNDNGAVAVSDPDLYEYCKDKIGEKVTVTYKVRDDDTGYDVIKIEK